MKSLRIYVDFKSANAYLAILPSIKLATATQTNIDWRPFLTKGRTVPLEAKEGESKGERHIRVREKYRRETQAKYAAAQGIPLTFPTQSIDTTLALAQLDSITSDRTAYVQAAFAAYWQDGADLNDPDIVSAILTSCGHTFDHSLANTVSNASAQQAIDDGVIDTPAYVIQGQLFIGREHLPWVESLLRETS